MLTKFSSPSSGDKLLAYFDEYFKDEMESCSRLLLAEISC